LRCMLVAISVSLSYLSATFDSLFEMRYARRFGIDEQTLAELSILYLRCLTRFSVTCNERIETFNSLFEMHAPRIRLRHCA